MQKMKLAGAVATVVALVGVGPAQAGGYDRFQQSIDLLFDPAQYAINAGVSYTAPQFVYSRITSPVFGTASNHRTDLSAALPKVEIKAGWGDADCMGNYSIPYGASAANAVDWVGQLNYTEKELKDQQLALTCSYAFAIGPGALRIIGGVNYEMATYTQTKNYSALALAPPVFATLDLAGESFGWRAGVAYEIPEYAVRASLMYFSAVDVAADGSITNLPIGGGAFAPLVPVYADATIPQSVELKLQSGIAPGWLASASVKWTDWSVWQKVDIKQQGTGALITWLNNYFTDGWTVGGSIGHQFSDTLSGQIGVTWDQGVGTGWTEHTDTYTLSAGAKYKLTENVDLYGGLAYTVISAGEVDKVDAGDLASTTSAWDTNFAVSGQVGLTARF